MRISYIIIINSNFCIYFQRTCFIIYLFNYHYFFAYFQLPRFMFARSTQKNRRRLAPTRWPSCDHPFTTCAPTATTTRPWRCAAPTARACPSHARRNSAYSPRFACRSATTCMSDVFCCVLVLMCFSLCVLRHSMAWCSCQTVRHTQMEIFELFTKESVGALGTYLVARAAAIRQALGKPPSFGIRILEIGCGDVCSRFV